MTKNFDNPDGRFSITISLAEVPAALSGHAMSEQSRKNIMSAINTFSRVVGLPASSIPADPIRVQSLLNQADPAAHGIGEVRWKNVKTELKRALRLLYGETRSIELTEGWAAIVALGQSATDKSMLRRWGRFSIKRSIEPDAVDDTHLTAFHGELKLQDSKAPDRIIDDTRRIWNRIALAHPELALKVLAVESRTDSYVLPWPAFPASLEADTIAFCSPMNAAGLFNVGA